MKKGWEVFKLGEVAKFEGGSQPPKSNFIYLSTDGYVRFLQIRDFGSDKNITYIPNSTKNRLCSAESILIGRYGASVGKILTGKAGAYNVALMKAEPNLDITTKEWFYHFLISDEFQKPLLNISARSAQAGFSKEDIHNFIFPAPPLPEQKRIVTVLEDAFEKISKLRTQTEKKISNLYEAGVSLSRLTFRNESWRKTTLNQISTNLDSKRIPVTKNKRKPGAYPYYGASGVVDFVDKYIFEGSNLLVSEDGANLLARSTPIAFTASGKYWVNNHAHILNFQDESIHQFVEYYLNSIDLKEFITGAAQPKLNQQALNSIEILIPDEAEERSKVVLLLDTMKENTTHLTTLYQRKLALLDELKQSVLHQAFNGDL